MVFGCTRLMTVARGIYNQGGWWLFRRLQDASAPYVTILSLVDFYLHLA
jgi:hypothetical protein